MYLYDKIAETSEEELMMSEENNSLTFEKLNWLLQTNRNVEFLIGTRIGEHLAIPEEPGFFNLEAPPEEYSVFINKLERLVEKLSVWIAFLKMVGVSRDFTYDKFEAADAEKYLPLVIALKRNILNLLPEARLYL